MNVEKSGAVVYIDGLGREHAALVTALNGTHEGFATLVYVDVNAPEPDNLKKIFDVAHVTHESLQEPNPNLPSYDVNCWKFPKELHRALPSDHPAFDHPFKEPERDEEGNIIPVPRPQTEAELRAHQAGLALKDVSLPSPDDLDRMAEEQSAKEATTTPDDTPVEAQTPDYRDLRAQLNDYTSTFYGPHSCECPAFSPEARRVVRRDIEQGGEMYSERDPNLGPPRYELHFCVKPSAPEAQTSAPEPDVTEMLDQAPPPPAEPETPAEE